MFSKSIRIKLMVPTLLLTVILLSILGMFLGFNSFEGIKSILTAKAESTVDFISKISSNSYKNFEFFNLDTLVHEIKKDAEVDFAVFYDADGAALTKKTGSGTTSFIIVERNIVDENGKKLGSLKVGFNRTKIDANLRNTFIIISFSIFAAILVFLFCMKILSERLIIHRIVEMEELANKLASGDMSVVVTTRGEDEIASLGRTMNKMAANLRELIGKTRSRNTELEEWQRNELRIKNGLHELDVILRDDQEISVLADRALSFLIGFLDAGVGIIYLYDEKEEKLMPLATYAVSGSERLNCGFKRGEGLAGQVALERRRISLTTVPPDYLQIASALGKADPLNVVVLPIMHNDKLVGVLESGSFRPFDDDDVDFLTQSLEGIAVVFSVKRSRQMVSDLLEQMQLQAGATGN